MGEIDRLPDVDDPSLEVDSVNLWSTTEGRGKFLFPKNKTKQTNLLIKQSSYV